MRKAKQTFSTFLHPQHHQLLSPLYRPPYLLLLGGYQALLFLQWGILYLHHQVATHLLLLHLVIHHSDHPPCLFMGHHSHLTCLCLLDMECHALHLVLLQYTIHLRILIVWVQGRVGKEVLVHQPLQLQALRLLISGVELQLNLHRILYQCLEQTTINML